MLVIIPTVLGFTDNVIRQASLLYDEFSSNLSLIFTIFSFAISLALCKSKITYKKKLLNQLLSLKLIMSNIKQINSIQFHQSIKIIIDHN